MLVEGKVNAAGKREDSQEAKSLGHLGGCRLSVGPRLRS